jgi:Protein of unknown function (DUF2877)
VAIGAIAHAALERTAGRARVLARLHGSSYLTAGETIVWLGSRRATLHPRAILSTTALETEAGQVVLDVGGLTPWRPEPLTLDREAAANLVEGWRALARDATALGPPAGFGALLTGGAPAFPLDGAGGVARALARACARDDPAGAATAALSLLGVGNGLTPSGDDFVGAALFVRAQLALLVDPPAWRRAADTVVAAAPACTHPISVALLADLAAGRSWAPLHDLVAALATRHSGRAAEAARALVGLGHTSGWDLFAGLGAGLGALG